MSRRHTCGRELTYPAIRGAGRSTVGSRRADRTDGRRIIRNSGSSAWRHLGDFPQAFTHLALISAVMHVIRAEQSREPGDFNPANPGS
ncbi:hypothetical protein OHA21_16520 [Actinoplanes sp. NBC_00393]|uniref:hypothetical protein n=1 Tax=Actinoplanes sp. NBC_00393 TaxID=2975953 RepID=UPI002E1AA9D2